MKQAGWLAGKSASRDVKEVGWIDFCGNRFSCAFVLNNEEFQHKVY